MRAKNFFGKFCHVLCVKQSSSNSAGSFSPPLFSIFFQKLFSQGMTLGAFKWW